MQVITRAKVAQRACGWGGNRPGKSRKSAWNSAPSSPEVLQIPLGAVTLCTGQSLLAWVEGHRHRSPHDQGFMFFLTFLTLLRQAVTEVNQTSPKVEKNPKPKQAIVRHGVQEGSHLRCIFSFNQHKGSTWPLFLCWSILQFALHQRQRRHKVHGLGDSYWNGASSIYISAPMESRVYL